MCLDNEVLWNKLWAKDISLDPTPPGKAGLRFLCLGFVSSILLIVEKVQQWKL